MTDYDFAGKTGTTQNAADGWFMLMHPDLVTGAWVGFNDRRIAFKSTFWGQGAHNALFLVGSYLRGVVDSPTAGLSKKEFPRPEEFRPDYELPIPGEEGRRRDGDRRVGW